MNLQAVSRMQNQNRATPIIAQARMISGAVPGIRSMAAAPKAEPRSVRAINAGNRFRAMIFLPANGNAPPTLMNVSASMLVAIAAWGSIPKLIMTGTVMSEVLPVTTLTTLVRKNTVIRAIHWPGGTAVA